LLGVAPALIVVAGSFLLSREYAAEADRARARDEKAGRGQGELVLRPSAEDEERLHRVALKEETVADLLAGRLTLADAVDRFEMLSRSAREGEQPAVSGPAVTDTGRAVHQILSFARVCAAHQPERFGGAVARLESEAEAFLARQRATH
jgi:hypothetical protein